MGSKVIYYCIPKLVTVKTHDSGLRSPASKYCECGSEIRRIVNKKILSWLRECLRKYQACAKVAAPYVPEGKDAIRLVLPAEDVTVVTTYLTLSHC